MAFRSSSRNRVGAAGWAIATLGILLLSGCRTVSRAPAGAPSLPAGDEIVVAGRRFHTGTRVVTWLEPGGYNAYAGQPGFGEREPAPKPRGWDLGALQKVVDQFVLHYDACGLSKVCFNALQQRRLSVQFLLDVDGTIYQTMDLKERAAHATVSNNRSIGIEIANIGAYAPGDTHLLDEWYHRDSAGGTRLTVPARIQNPWIRTPHFAGRPDRATPVRGRIQDHELTQYDFTPEQYAALAKLTAALCRVFPRLKCDYPHDAAGRLRTSKLSDRELAKFHGVLGHFHIQADKIDPGPALQWRRVIDEARRQLQ